MKNLNPHLIVFSYFRSRPQLNPTDLSWFTPMVEQHEHGSQIFSKREPVARPIDGTLSGGKLFNHRRFLGFSWTNSAQSLCQSSNIRLDIPYVVLSWPPLDWLRLSNRPLSVPHGHAVAATSWSVGDQTLSPSPQLPHPTFRLHASLGIEPRFVPAVRHRGSRKSSPFRAIFRIKNAILGNKKILSTLLHDYGLPDIFSSTFFVR